LHTTISKDHLKREIFAGNCPAIEVIYNRYGGMLFSYILQFLPDRAESGSLLADILARLAPRLQEAFDSSLSIYCWLQVETRRHVLAYIRDKNNGGSVERDRAVAGVNSKTYYSGLLQDASPEHQYIFREVFIHGQDKEEVAAHSGKDPVHVGKILRECLLIIRKKLA
jgi:DNA-directed RNA polymerase specialized sigma24 family protein